MDLSPRTNTNDDAGREVDRDVRRNPPGNSCLSPSSDTSKMHLPHQLKACPDQRSGGEKRHKRGRAPRLAPCKQRCSHTNPELPPQQDPAGTGTQRPQQRHTSPS